MDEKIRNHQRLAAVDNDLYSWQQYAHVLEQALGIGSLPPGKTEFSDHFNQLLRQTIADQCKRIMKEEQIERYLEMLEQKFESLGFDDSFDGIKFEYKKKKYHVVYDGEKANILIYYKFLKEWASMVRSDSHEPLRFLIEGGAVDE